LALAAQARRVPPLAPDADRAVALDAGARTGQPAAAALPGAPDPARGRYRRLPALAQERGPAPARLAREPARRPLLRLGRQRATQGLGAPGPCAAVAGRGPVAAA